MVLEEVQCRDWNFLVALAREQTSVGKQVVIHRTGEVFILSVGYFVLY